MGRKRTLTVALVVPFAFAVACADPMSTTAPAEQTPAIVSAEQPSSLTSLTSLTCTASVAQGTLTCTSPDERTSDGAPNVIIGGQSRYVTLAASNFQQPTPDSFTVNVQVTNLIPQTLGTSNGTAADPAGVRVFFVSGPTSTNGGTIRVTNPDGTGTFTAAGQPYFQYNGLLTQASSSATKTWRFQHSGGVTGFTFTAYVSTVVRYPNGYVDGTPYVITLNPNESRTLTGTARTYLGDSVPGQAVSWATSAPAIAAVSGTQVTAGGARGFATLTPTAGIRPAVYTTAVAVCQATVVTNGTSLPSSIASTDCFSSYGDPNGLPTTSYYSDLYRVTLAAGQTITVTMDSGDDLDTYLLLVRGSDGILVAGNDDDDTGVLGVGSRAVYTATTPGLYVIEASTFNGLDTGNYTLGVTISSGGSVRVNAHAKRSRVKAR